jgi:hypothetical protein
MLKINKLYFYWQYFGHLPFIGLFTLILLRDNDLLFLETYFDIYHSGFLYPNIYSEQRQIIPNNILNINPFGVSLSEHY